jgi:hypothetical protein
MIITERSQLIRRHESKRTDDHEVIALTTDVIDTTQFTVHTVIGGGGTFATSNLNTFVWSPLSINLTHSENLCAPGR